MVGSLFIGHSYGGRTAFIAAAHDDRVRATASGGGSTTYVDMIRHHTGIQAEFIVPGTCSLGDFDDLLRYVEPRALMLLGASEDRWSIALDAMLEHGR